MIRGDHVRIESAVLRGEFIVAAVAGDTLIVDDGGDVRVPRSARMALHLRKPSSVAGAVVRGAGAGLLTGAALAAATDFLTGEDGGFFGRASDVIGETLVPFMLAGTALGALSALVFSREQWVVGVIDRSADRGAACGGVRIGYRIGLRQPATHRVRAGK